MRTKNLWLAAVSLACCLCLASNNEVTSYEDTDQPFDFHGRLGAYNGNPCFRIWIIGTHRVLGVSGGDLEPAAMPTELEELMVTNGFSTLIYADFNVSPLTKYEKGHMQMVQIDAVSNLVVYIGDQFIEKRKTL